MDNSNREGWSPKFTRPATFPNKIIVDVGAANQVGEEAKSLGAKKALIITGQQVTKAGLVDGIKESLQSAKIHVGVFDQVEAEPPAHRGDECAKLVRQEGYEVIIGLGGGSSLDIAKATSIMATNKGKLLDYVIPSVVPKKGLPMILLPTTAGSGSETSPGIAVVDEADHTKRAVSSRFMHPDVVIIDPLLTLSMPKNITAYTGIDALSHAIEAFIAVHRHPFGDVLAIEAIQLIARNLPVAYLKGNNIEARFNMSLAATMAGLCVARGLTILHGLSVFLGAKYHLPHGVAIAIMLPHVMSYTITGNPKKYAYIAQAMGEDIENHPLHEAGAKSISAIKRLLTLLNISIKLRDYGASSEDLPDLVEAAMKLPARHFENTPGDLTQEDIRNIYLEAF
jgi:alcohol dehydrogenase class IV